MIRQTNLVNRLLETSIFVYAGLSAFQWSHAARWIYVPPWTFMCGNVISDPYMGLVNVVVPLAAVANVALIYRSRKLRQWSLYTITATLIFVTTSIALVYEGYWLTSQFGLPLGDVWWLPWV